MAKKNAERDKKKKRRERKRGGGERSWWAQLGSRGEINRTPPRKRAKILLFFFLKTRKLKVAIFGVAKNPGF